MFMLPDPRSASRTRFCRYVPQRLRRGGVRVIAGIVGDVADLSTVTTAHRRGRDHHLHGCQAFAGSDVPAPFTAELLCLGRYSR